jgi:type 1 glutamine amidotransferase
MARSTNLFAAFKHRTAKRRRNFMNREVVPPGAAVNRNRTRPAHPADHPIMQGLPPRWLHTQDECYDRLRGPAEHLTVLATAYSSPDYKGTDRHEPMLMAIDYGQGRVFHTTLGHEDYSFESVGFIVTFLRGAEWAATGRVTVPVPPDFHTETEAKRRPFVDR